LSRTEKLAALPLFVSSAADGTSLGQGGVVFGHGGHEVVGGHEPLGREAHGPSVVLAGVAVVLDTVAFAPREPDVSGMDAPEDYLNWAAIIR
jgi:hypothetical protein